MNHMTRDELRKRIAVETTADIVRHPHHTSQRLTVAMEAHARECNIEPAHTPAACERFKALEDLDRQMLERMERKS